MGLQVIIETVEAIEKQSLFQKEDQQFVMEFALKTNDKELTNKLIDDLAKQDSDFAVIRARYEALYDRKPKWIDQFENLLVALEMYRVEEEKAIHRISEVLIGYGIDVTPDEIRKTDTEELKQRVQKEAVL